MIYKETFRMNQRDLDEERIERIESLVDLYAIDHFKQSTNTIIVDMINEGWEYSDVREYLFDKIEENIAAHKRQDAMDELTHKCTQLIGRKCIVIDEMLKQNNVEVHTISEIGENGGLRFEGYAGETIFAFDYDIKLFTQGYKAYIHPGEVSIQLVG
jgi:hypothetical protein